MLKEIITQVDGYCEECGDYKPKGIRCYYDEGNVIYCLGCVAEELGSE